LKRIKKVWTKTFDGGDTNPRRTTEEVNEWRAQGEKFMVGLDEEGKAAMTHWINTAARAMHRIVDSNDWLGSRSTIRWW
jgi:hypothetical protein